MFLLLFLLSFLSLEWFYSFSSTVLVFGFKWVVCVFLDFFKEFVHFLFKDLSYQHTVGFNVFFLCFSSDGKFRDYCWGSLARVETSCPGWYSVCSYSGVQASEFVMILGLGTEFWVCLCWVGVFFPVVSVSFLGYLKVCWPHVTWFCDLLSWCVCHHYWLVFYAGILRCVEEWELEKKVFLILRVWRREERKRRSQWIFFYRAFGETYGIGSQKQ